MNRNGSSEEPLGPNTRGLKPGVFLFLFSFSSCPGDDALPNGLDVTFEVTELRRMTGSYNTMVGNNEGSMVSWSPNDWKGPGKVLEF